MKILNEILDIIRERPEEQWDEEAKYVAYRRDLLQAKLLQEMVEQLAVAENHRGLEETVKQLSGPKLQLQEQRDLQEMVKQLSGRTRKDSTAERDLQETVLADTKRTSKGSIAENRRDLLQEIVQQVLADTKRKSFIAENLQEMIHAENLRSLKKKIQH